MVPQLSLCSGWDRERTFRRIDTTKGLKTKASVLAIANFTTSSTALEALKL